MTAESAGYGAMVLAINECHCVDEVKDVRDKAVALAKYAEQAQNRDAKRKVCEIRVRAECRAGKPLTQLTKEGKRAR